MSSFQTLGSLRTQPFWADRLGAWTSALCLIHCALAPILLSGSVVAAHLLPSEEHTHRTLAVLVAALGAIALLYGFRRHRRWQVLGLMAGGLGCIAFAAFRGDALPSHAAEVFVTMLGSLLMVAAHRRNHTFCRSCACVGNH
jgi:MerC mercury resistance protein